ncbi:hypothetical protein A0J61_10883 [Choanephora cucurbitarum]|uniref:Retrotransposon gag domain-containing protein n=1 Tax=Choanephora cucurbitarum TaxID=101091 RepID=A0A1C7MWC4_9FUNG|nr:hypothetical protein A0J61_10883 [Choanephora cucurbitarum]
MDNPHQSSQDSNVHPAVIDFVTQLTRVLQSQTADSSQKSLAKPPSIQLQRPNAYDGSRNVWKLDSWIRSIDRLKECYSWDDLQTFRFAHTFLSGRAEAWFSSQEINGTGPSNWPSFKHLLVITFRPANAEDMVRDRLYNTRQASSIHAYVDTFMDISMLLNTSGLTPQQVMDCISDRTLERVLREALDFESAHHPSGQSTVKNTGYAPNILRSSAHSGTAFDSSQTLNDPMDCNVLHSCNNYPQQSSYAIGNKDNRVSRTSFFAGTCHYCSRKGHKINECRTRAKDLANYESKMKDKYRQNQTSNCDTHHDKRNMYFGTIHSRILAWDTSKMCTRHVFRV